MKIYYIKLEIGFHTGTNITLIILSRNSFTRASYPK